MTHPEKRTAFVIVASAIVAIFLGMYWEFRPRTFDSKEWKAAHPEDDLRYRMAENVKQKMLQESWSLRRVFGEMGSDLNATETFDEFRARNTRKTTVVVYNLGNYHGIWWMTIYFDESGMVNTVRITPE